MKAEGRVALVTGGSSGIGLSCSRALAGEGWQVYTLSRRQGSGEFPHLSADVTDPAACSAAVEQVLVRAGRLDLLVSCAGFGISGAAEFTSPEEARAQIEVNLFGSANMCRAVIPPMRRAGGGRIILISSVAAATPIPFQSWYSVSKAGLNAYAMALANEVGRFGISVSALMPGDTRTGFTDARRKEAAGDAVYEGAIARSVAKMERDERGGVSPDQVGRLVARIARQRRPKVLSTVGVGYGFLVLLSRLLPVRLVNYILGMMYAR